MGSAWWVLGVTTFAYLVCFAVWLLFAVIGIPIRKELGLDATQFGLLTATPILSGALLRVPVGAWTDRFGGRRVMPNDEPVGGVEAFIAEIDFPPARSHYCSPRGRPGFDGGSEVAWSMPRASSSS